MPNPLPPIAFLNASGVILDVRSPGEYEQGHIPGAISFPLFTNEERAQVGICYKQEGRDRAVELGFAIAGPKFASFIAHAKELTLHEKKAEVRIHCWRGGMRSEAVAWVLEMAGFKASVLFGGYKAFRRWALAQFSLPGTIAILGGMTGTGKTKLLHQLAAQGEQILDLEALAHHRGSSYGALGLPPQPTNEHFENEIAIRWANFDRQRPIWIEAESKRIGLCRIPEPLFQQMDQAPVIEVVKSRSERLSLLVEIYGALNLEELIIATARIGKRLGGLRTQEAIALLQERKLAEAFDIILDYYDKTYTYDLKRRKVSLHPIDFSAQDEETCALQLIEKSRQILPTPCYA